MATIYAPTNVFAQSVDKFGYGPYDPAIAPAVQLLEKTVSPFAPFAGVVAQTLPDYLMDSTVTQVATNLNLYAIMLSAGDIINNFNVISVGAASTPAHWWFVLATSTYFPVALSADQTTTATAADAKVTVPVATVGIGSTAGVSVTSTTYTVLTSGLYYVGLMQAPTTTAFTLQGHSANGAGRGAFAPYLSFVSNTGASGLPAFGTALTASAVATPTAIAGVYLN